MKRVYLFEEGDGKNRRLLGGKGAGLCEMTRMGLPVPPGFVITTETCLEYYSNGGKLPAALMDEVRGAIRDMEKRRGTRFGDPKNPLLVSVRSGAMLSMPGMMDTILNLGLNEETVEELAASTGDERFAYDAYRRFIQMFGKIVLDVDGKKFDEVFEQHKEKVRAKLDTDLSADDLKRVAIEFKRLIERETKTALPSDPYEQLRLAIEAVFNSWNNKRALEYRSFYKIPDDLGTAVNVVAMVFGNMGPDSGTGVAFTRDPSTGEKRLYGEFLLTAQGEDVVAGVRTPLKIEEMKERYPRIYDELHKIAGELERHYRDMQDVEFTMERGRLWMLQTRAGKRTAEAAVKIAVDMVEEGLIDRGEALLRVEASHVEWLLHPRIDPKAKVHVVARGINASPGAATGKAVLDADMAKTLGGRGEKVILVRPETNPDDVGGMIASQGVLTARGGATSHAAVVSRGLGKPSVVGCDDLSIDLDKRMFKAGEILLREGDVITLNGTTGEVILGEVPLLEPEMSSELRKLLSWADDVKKLGNWANADYPRDARRAREFGAQGIGLCRTERMFREEDRLAIVHEMILAETLEDRKKALDQLLPVQREDFKGILKEMDGLPVVIRLLDPPLHEFLPSYEELVTEVVELRLTGKDEARLRRKEKMLKRVEVIREANPMLGLRGCRLGITHPEIYEMQVRAIFEAACELKRDGYRPRVQVMIPLVGHVSEIRVVRKQLEEVARKVMTEQGVEVPYKFGTMMEIPRAAITADEIVQFAEFFSFGTNDLTQMTFGYSRDDAEGKFLYRYLQDGLLDADPFQSLDVKGVGKLMKMAVELGRSVRPDLEVGICGEHGGDPESVRFCHDLNLNYVSCSAFRVPVARLAAAHAVLREKTTTEKVWATV